MTHQHRTLICHCHKIIKQCKCNDINKPVYTGVCDDCKKNESLLYIVTAYKGGHKDCHHYIVGIYNTFNNAKKASIAEEAYRGGNKYYCQITSCPISDSWSEDFIGLVCEDVKPNHCWRTKYEQGQFNEKTYGDGSKRLKDTVSRLENLIGSDEILKTSTLIDLLSIATGDD